MNKNLFFAMLLLATSCTPDTEIVEPTTTQDDPVAVTLTLSREYHPLAVMQSCTFTYTDITGFTRFEVDPENMQVDSVDFVFPVTVTGYATNGMNQQIACVWVLAKDMDVIDVQETAYYSYEH